MPLAAIRRCAFWLDAGEDIWALPPATPVFLDQATGEVSVSNGPETLVGYCFVSWTRRTCVAAGFSGKHPARAQAAFMQVHLAGMAAVCMCLQLSHDSPSWQGMHAELASEHLASVAATSALQLLAPAAAAPLGQDPAEYLAACGFFVVLAAWLRRQRLTAWHMWAHLSHQAVGHAIAATAGRLDVWPDSSVPQPSDALLGGLAACTVAHMSRCRLPLPPPFLEGFRAAQLVCAGRAVWTDCSILAGMLRSRRRRRHALAAGAVPAMVAALVPPVEAAVSRSRCSASQLPNACISFPCCVSWDKPLPVSDMCATPYA